MKKIVIGGLIMIGLGIGVFLVLRVVMTKQLLQYHINEFVDATNAFRPSLGIKQHDLLAYFDEPNYDPNSKHPLLWIEEWKIQNVNAEFTRQVDKIEVKEDSKGVVRVEFTLLEGLKGYEEKGIKPVMEPYRYKAVLVNDAAKGKWLFRALDQVQ